MKTKKFNIIEVECGELEATITKYFQEFCGFDPKEDEQNFYFRVKALNTLSDFYNIDGKLNKNDLEIVQKIIDKKNFNDIKASRVRILLNYLCSNGAIESGNYLVRVGW